MVIKMSELKKRGRLVVVSGPSGVGKGTVLKYVLENEDFVYSVSATTRNKREGEENGVNYFFISKEDFSGMIDRNELIEYANYNGNFYGTPKFFVEDMLSQGKNVILEIEVKGAVQIKSIVPGAVFVFIAPESKDVLAQRLRTRGTETEDVVANRLAIAENEIRSCLMYDYIVINREGKAKECADDIMSAVKAHNFKPENAYTDVGEFFS